VVCLIFPLVIYAHSGPINYVTYSIYYIIHMSEKIESGISVIATGDGLVWANHSSLENILAYHQVRSPIAQLLVSIPSPDNFSWENIS